MILSRNSTSEKLQLIKDTYENQIHLKFATFQKKYDLKEALSNDRYQKNLNMIRERSLKAKKRREEAAMRRKLLEETKRKKILFQRQIRSDVQRTRNGSVLILKPSSKPGVYINSVLTLTEIEGISGFGGGLPSSKSEPTLVSRNGENLYKTSIFENTRFSGYPVLRPTTLNSDSEYVGSSYQHESRRPESRRQSFCSGNGSGIEGSEWPSSADVSAAEYSTLMEEPHSDCSGQRSSVSVMGDSSSTSESHKQRECIVPEKTLFRYKRDAKRYRSLRSLKRVTFRQDNFDTDGKALGKPSIKKTLHIHAPETKKGILLKMNEVSSKHRSVSLNKFDNPNWRSKADSISDNFVSVFSGKGDSNKAVDPQKSKGVRHTSRGTSTDDKEDNNNKENSETAKDSEEKQAPIFGRLLESCVNEKQNRKLKLAKLHEDLKNIEKETKRLTDKNAEYTKKLITKTMTENNNRSDRDPFGETQDAQDSKAKMFANFLKSRLSLKQFSNKTSDDQSSASSSKSVAKPAWMDENNSNNILINTLHVDFGAMVDHGAMTDLDFTFGGDLTSFLNQDHCFFDVRWTEEDEDPLAGTPRCISLFSLNSLDLFQ